MSNCENLKLKKSFNSKAKNLKNFSSHEKIIAKIENFPLSPNSKNNLANLIESDKILDITKILDAKNGSSIILLGKINLTLKAFSNLNLESDEVLIKVLPDANTKFYELFAYTKNKSNYSKNSRAVGSYFNSEPLAIFKYKNVIIMKKFQNAKTLSHISKESPENLVEVFGEILQQVHDIRCKDENFWKLKLDIPKKILKSDEKWIFINLIDASNEHQNGSNFTENVSELFELFYSYGVSENDLESQFLKYFRSFQWTCVEWRRMTSFVIMERYFTPIESMSQSRRKHKRYFRKRVENVE